MPLVYARMFPLHPLLQKELPLAEGLPEEILGLSAEKMDAGGIYLLENGQEAFIGFAPHPDPIAVRLLLGRSPAPPPSPCLLRWARECVRARNGRSRRIGVTNRSLNDGDLSKARACTRGHTWQAMH